MNINLVILLSVNHDKDANDIVHFPGNFEMVNVLNKTVSKEVNQGEEEYGDKEEIPLDEAYAVIWDNSSKQEWFISMAREGRNKEGYLIYYLKSDPYNLSRKRLRYPCKPDE